MKSFTAICLILGFVSCAFAAQTLTTNSAGTFLKGPFVVLNGQYTAAGGNATDNAAWGEGAASGGNNANSNAWAGAYTKFYPGADNNTIWLTSSDATSKASTFIIAFITRKISALVIVNGTNSASQESVVAGSGAILASVTATASYRAAMAYGTAVGAYLTAVSVGPGSTTNGDILQIISVVAGSATVKAISTGSTSTGTSGSAGYAAYAYAPLAVWGEDGAYYVVYEIQSSTYATAAATASLGVFLQGYNSSGVIYTTAPTVIASGTITKPGTFGTSSASAVAGGSNFTNSSMWLVQVFDSAATKPVLYSLTVGKTSGTVTNVATLTSTFVSGTPVAGQITYGLGNIIPSVNNGTYGFIVPYSVVATTTPTYTYNLTVLLNGSATPTNLGFSLSSGTAVPMGMGFRSFFGFGVIAANPTGTTTASTAVVYSGLVYYNNGTQNTNVTASQSALGTYNTAVPPSIFIDVNGSLWFGFGTADSASTPANVILGASIAQVYTNINAVYPSAGSVLATIAALISFVIASLFMF